MSKLVNRAAGAAVLAFILGLLTCCGGTSLAQERAFARATSSLVGNVWILAAEGCRDAAVLANSQPMLDKCAAALEPAYQAILAVDGTIDATSGSVSLCSLLPVVTAVDAATTLPGVSSPAVKVALNDAKILVASCSAKDAGAK